MYSDSAVYISGTLPAYPPGDQRTFGLHLHLPRHRSCAPICTWTALLFTARPPCCSRHDRLAVHGTTVLLFTARPSCCSRHDRLAVNGMTVFLFTARPSCCSRHDRLAVQGGSSSIPRYTLEMLLFVAMFLQPYNSHR